MPLIFNDVTAVIANGASLSGAIALGAGAPVALVMPATWTAANLTFKGSIDGSTFFDLYDDAGNEVTVTAAASRFISLTAVLFAGCRWLQVRSGTGSVPVAQGAARSIQIVTRRAGAHE